MPLMILALCSIWWKATFKTEDRNPKIIVLMPEDGDPQFKTSRPAAYEQ
jgi:hypothetical protein